MLATITSAALKGINAEIVHVEVNAGEVGEPKLILVGLPDAAVKESDDRVFSALSNSGFRPPRTRTTINLAPANLRKEGPFYDLPIALGILAATKQLNAENLGDWLIAGELSLSGATRPVRGALAMARLARSLGKRGVLLPGISAEEAAMVEGVAVYRVDSLDRAVRFLSGEIPLNPLDAVASRRGPLPSPKDTDNAGFADFSEIKRQHALRRAVEVAVSGFHNLLMISVISPGTALRVASRTDRTGRFQSRKAPFEFLDTTADAKVADTVAAGVVEKLEGFRGRSAWIGCSPRRLTTVSRRAAARRLFPHSWPHEPGYDDQTVDYNVAHIRCPNPNVVAAGARRGRATV